MLLNLDWVVCLKFQNKDCIISLPLWVVLELKFYVLM